MKYILILGVIISLSACQSKDIIAPIAELESLNYLHISHTRSNSIPNMLAEVEQIDFSKYDMLWLGGDMSLLSSNDHVSMDYLDSYFQLSSPNTLWALGNHDYTNLDLVEAYTGRPPYYAYHSKGITFIVLDTQDSLSNIVGDQLALFNSVMDTLEASSHLVLLTHKLIWMYDQEYLNGQIDSVSNGLYGSCFHCLNPNNFYDDIYPRLIAARMGGIKVLCLAGDIGFKVNGFSYSTSEDIIFLASGVSYTSELNFALLFQHKVKEKTLTWEFKPLSEL
jgi:hypothetical protein